MLVAVSEGTANADSLWMLTTDDPITIGTTALTFQQIDAGILLNSINVWNKSQRGKIQVPTFAATQTFDFSLGNHFIITATSNFTLANPTNMVVGQSGTIEIAQDGTGSRVISWGTWWVAAGGTKPVLSTAANARDLLSYFVKNNGTIFVNIAKGIA